MAGRTAFLDGVQRIGGGQRWRRWRARVQGALGEVRITLFRRSLVRLASLAWVIAGAALLILQRPALLVAEFIRRERVADEGERLVDGVELDLAVGVNRQRDALKLALHAREIFCALCGDIERRGQGTFDGIQTHLG